MPTAVIMPKFEMTQETGKVARWLKSEGEAVTKGEALLEVETDKVNLEVEAPADGILRRISAGPGDVVPIGKTIAEIVKPGETISDTGPAGTGEASSGPAPGSPHEGASHAGAGLAWGRPHRAAPTGASHAGAGKPSPRVRVASPLAVRMAESLGIDLELMKGTGPRGQVTREDVETYALSHRVPSTPDDETTPGAFAAVPAARRLARELGVDLHAVQGTGPEGRIQSRDVVAHFEAASAEKTAGESAPEPAPVQPEPSAPSVEFPGSPAIRRMVPLTNIRRTIAERMTASVRETPQFTVSLDADMTRALAIVEDLRKDDATPGDRPDQPRVTLTAYLIKACAWALCRHPGVNAAYQDEQVAEFDDVNIGVATAIEAGLIVPVIHRADRLRMREIAARLADLTSRARENRLKIEDLQGGTFTVSNLGMFGIDRFTAILNPPQAAILAVGRVAKRTVVAADDRVEVRPVTTLTLTADHRVLDGVTAAQYLATLQRVLEHPGLLLE